MHPFRINRRSYLIDRIQQELPATDLIAWLQSQPLYPKVFWKEQDSQTIYAAVGSLILFPTVPQLCSSNPFEVRLYGGMRFNDGSHNQETWRSFPNTCFWLPQIEISQEGDHAQVIAYSLNGPASFEPLLTYKSVKMPAAPSSSLIERKETPCFGDWKKNMEVALNSIASGHMQKLVLARKTTLQFATPLSPWPLLTHLNQMAKRATLFAFQLSPSLCFLGATPEKLFQRKENLFNTDAIAATRPRGQTPEEDLRFEEELLSNPKDLREFKIVKDFLQSALLPLSEEMSWEGKDCVLKVSHVQHLHNRLSAQLKSGISDADLIRTLHPTPALGGHPRDEALKFLGQIEPFDRGWYGAPIGVIGQKSTSLYIAIRSALIQERLLHLFAGAGLVHGSIAEREWEELEQKIRPFTELFF
jgi:menaquinone-specific isochorismate synthase